MDEQPDGDDTVGVVGLGALGSLVAARILQAGHRVLGWDRRPEARLTLEDQGGHAASSLSDLARANTVISLVLDDDNAREVTTGPDGLVALLGPGAIHVMMSSISPQLSTELSRTHAERGQQYLAAPVFGRADTVAAELTIVCSGADSAFDRVTPLLAAIGRVRRVGSEPGQAMLVKSIGNSMIFTAMETLREVFQLLEAGGVPSEAATETLVNGLFPGPIFAGYAARYQQDPDRFHLGDLARKDRRNCLAVAAQLGVDVPLIQFLHDSNLP